MCRVVCWGLILALPAVGSAEQIVLQQPMKHLRAYGAREWETFPKQPQATGIDLKFRAKANAAPQTLLYRQQDVKQQWEVRLNGKSIGRLRIDENDMVDALEIPKGTLIDGENRLTITQRSRSKGRQDDVRLGEIAIDSRSISKVLGEGGVEVEVLDQQTGKPLPARITIIRGTRTLQRTGTKSAGHLAIRPGLVFTSTGKAKFTLPAGSYRLFAGRGFEYSLATETLALRKGMTVRKTLRIRREVPTAGYVACDTHVHTLTHSGHGDASVRERMITLAAEGIELPIATDHNKNIDHRPFAKEAGVGRWMTPVIGNEVTTKIGHFNVFPIAPGAKPPNHKLDSWESILAVIFKTPGVRVAILNHARDIHSGVRPFGPKLHHSPAGENAKGWKINFNAMEVINSGAVQSDPMQLFRDWMGLLNRGYQITPVGSSDSHDVGRHFVGQGRTYLRADDKNPGRIDVDKAVDHFLAGRVRVSYGLLAEIHVGNKTSGDLVKPTADKIRVRCRVLGPGWTRATRLMLFANGEKIRDVELADFGELPLGVRASMEFELDRPRHDVHLVAIATGPGIEFPYWQTAKPYQPDSPKWKSMVIGCSGALWIDGDLDGKRRSAFDYAKSLTAKCGKDHAKLFRRLREYDQAVAIQTANLLAKSGVDINAEPLTSLIRKASAATRRGFRIYRDGVLAGEQARKKK